MNSTTTHRQRRQALSVLGAAVLLLFSATACPSRSTPAPLPTLPPTSTPAPTATPTATWTPAPLPTVGPVPTATPSYLITTVTAGETIEVGDLIMTVTPITSAASDPNLETGRRFVLLDLTIQNAGERLAGINSVRDLILKDSTNQVYRISAAALAAIGGTIPDVDLAPGETIRAQLGFDVPVEATDLTLSFAADRFDAGRIFVQLP
ncbi:MAG TPA: DUF4352 domain-containing protein [Anaerolineae bacterium]|nr:DUF4352 domain-containing protein [Anaerolineae bacterium]